MARPAIPLDALTVFEACVRTLNFTRAAEELNLTQAAVSLRIRTLEQRLGVPLFHRARPELRLTAAGEVLAPGVAEGLEVIAQALRAASAKGVQRLRVTAAPTFARRFLLPRLRAFEAAHPGLVVELESATAVRAVGARGWDVAIRSGVTPPSGAVRLMTIARTAMLSPALASAIGPLNAPQDLLRAPLFPDEAWTPWFAAAGAPLAGDPPRLATRQQTQEMAAEAVMEGAGVALLSPVLFGAFVTAGRLVQPFESVTEGPDSYFAVSDTKRPSPAAQAFVAWLVAALGRA